MENMVGKVRIRLALFGDTGAVASVENSDMDIVDIVTNGKRRDPQAMCIKAAARLRKLANDFERLSTMESPFKEKTQRAAEKTPMLPTD